MAKPRNRERIHPTPDGMGNCDRQWFDSTSRSNFVMSIRKPLTQQEWEAIKRRIWLNGMGAPPDHDYHQKQPVRKPPQFKLLRASNDFFTAGAVWKQQDGAWSCVKAAPILRWMIGLPKEKAHLELLKRGCTYSWVKTIPGTALGHK